MHAKILVVDDEQDLELLINQRFRQKIKDGSMSFDFANNGEQALDKLNNQSDVDIVLTDINMPVMDGLTLLRRIGEKKIPCKCVVVSAYGDLQNIREAMNSGAFDFITKPIDFRDLEKTIEKSLADLSVFRGGEQAKEQLEKTLLEKEIAEMERTKAEQSEKFKQQFLANMSHEIRTPMNAVIGLTSLLLKNNPREDQLRHLRAIQQSADNLLVIINDILDLSKIEAGKMQFEKTPFKPADVVLLVYNILQFKAEEKHISLITEVAPDVPLILLGDPTRLTQILINLAGNAIKFTESGSVTIHLSTKLKESDDESCMLFFQVIDTGIGIAADKLQTIFESFSQASDDTNRKYGGTGLGLTISKQLIELQNGTISVSSRLGSGTEFAFTIPYKRATEEAGAAAILKDDFPDVNLEGLVILLAEDNEFNQMVAIDTLEDMIPGIKIDVASNGRIAVDMLKAKDYNLVLMDIQMPEMDGYEATRTIRALEGDKSKTKIMAMTANATAEEINKCFQSGVNEYLSKPFKPDELMAKIKKTLAM
jgi:signal transduction histidine kinase